MVCWRIEVLVAVSTVLLIASESRAGDLNLSESLTSPPFLVQKEAVSVGGTKLEGFVEKGPNDTEDPASPIKKEQVLKPLYVPGLVPYSDEVTIDGVADFDKLRNDSTVKEKCLLVDALCRDSNLGIYKGRVLLNCKNDVHVVTPDATVDVGKGSIVYLYSTGESVVILNLHDDHRGSVKAHVDGEEIEIPPGREVLVTRYPDLSFDDARLCPGIWYRSVWELVSKPKLKVYLTQFSTISAAAIMPSVHRVIQKKDKTADKLAKTFAAVIMVSRDRQKFRPCMPSKSKLAESNQILNSKQD